MAKPGQGSAVTFQQHNNPPGLTRRDFLLEGGLVAAAALMATSGSTSHAAVPRVKNSGKGQSETMVKSPVRLAVVGGNFGAQFYWHEHPQCRVVAVSDLRPDRLAYMKHKYQCERGYSSLDALLADESLECDAVAIFTDATERVDHCIACLEKGKHVVAGSPAVMSLEAGRRLRRAVVASGLTYMLGETSYFQQSVISARKWHQAREFGDIFSCEAEYHHPGLEKLFVDEDGKPTWRYGLPPMLYSTHCTGQLLSVTGERLTQVSCTGWGDNDPIVKKNPFKNPFWCETALFQTDRGNAFRASVYWRGALGIAERAVWLGSKMSFFAPDPNGIGPIIRRTEAVARAASAAGERKPIYQKYDQKLWYETDLLPEPLRHISGHEGSHTFLTHAFIDALVTGGRPVMDVDFALDLALPGIIAHQSALSGGKLLKIPRASEL